MVSMKNYFLICVALSILLFFCGSKGISSDSLIGKWVLTKICVCNSCTDTIALYPTQTPVFSLSGQADLYGAVGNSE
jgi:hypothetical protein